MKIICELTVYELRQYPLVPTEPVGQAYHQLASKCRKSCASADLYAFMVRNVFLFENEFHLAFLSDLYYAI